MKVNIAREVADLKRMTVKELRGRYLMPFGAIRVPFGTDTTILR